MGDVDEGCLEILHTMILQRSKRVVALHFHNRVMPYSRYEINPERPSFLPVIRTSLPVRFMTSPGDARWAEIKLRAEKLNSRQG